jgi:hypothetical protein
MRKSGGRGLFVVGIAVLFAGCRSTPPSATTDGPRYPAHLVQNEVLDVQVFREGTRMRLTNTSTRRIGRSMVWVNRRFGREIGGLDIAQTLEMDLREFVDEYGQPFRAGGFFAPEAPQPLVLVQVQPLDGDPGLFGLIVARGEGE